MKVIAKTMFKFLVDNKGITKKTRVNESQIT